MARSAKGRRTYTELCPILQPELNLEEGTGTLLVVGRKVAGVNPRRMISLGGLTAA